MNNEQANQKFLKTKIVGKKISFKMLKKVILWGFMPTIFLTIFALAIFISIWSLINPIEVSNYVEKITGVKVTYINNENGATYGLFDFVLNSVVAVIYQVLIIPLCFVLEKLTYIVEFLSGGRLLNALLFKKSGIDIFYLQILFIIIGLIFVALIILLLKIMISDKPQQQFKTGFKNFIMCFIILLFLPTFFQIINEVINLITEEVFKNNSLIKTKNIALIIFNSSYLNGYHENTEVAKSITAIPDYFNFSPIICLIGIGIMLNIYLLITSAIIGRSLEIVLMMFIGMGYSAKAISDEGSSFKNWLELAIVLFLTQFVIYFTYSLFLWAIPIYSSIASIMSDNTAKPIFIMICIVSNAMLVFNSPKLLSSISGTSAGISGGMSSLATLIDRKSVV